MAIEISCLCCRQPPAGGCLITVSFLILSAAKATKIHFYEPLYRFAHTTLHDGSSSQFAV